MIMCIVCVFLFIILESLCKQCCKCISTESTIDYSDDDSNYDSDYDSDSEYMYNKINEYDNHKNFDNIEVVQLEEIVINNSSNISCVICLEDFEPEKDEHICYLECKHKYHTECIREWYNTYNTKYDTKCPCPICNQEIKKCIYIV